jgi:hypothetical protein
LGVVLTVAAAAVGELGLGVAQQGFIDVAHVLAAPVGVGNQAGSKLLGE